MLTFVSAYPVYSFVDFVTHAMSCRHDIGCGLLMSIHVSTASGSKWLNISRSFWRRGCSRLILCFIIRVFPKTRVLPFGTLSQTLDLANFSPQHINHKCCKTCQLSSTDDHSQFVTLSICLCEQQKEHDTAHCTSSSLLAETCLSVWWVMIKIIAPPLCSQTLK